MAEEPFRVLQLEEKLAKDEYGLQRDAIIGQLADARLALKSELNRGARPERYVQLVRLIDAIDAAETALPVLWTWLQPKEGV